MKNVEVAQAVAKGKAIQLERASLSANRVLEELRRLAFFDIRCLFSDSGTMCRLDDLTPEQSAAVASLEVVKKNPTAGDGQVNEVVKVRTHDKGEVSRCWRSILRS